MKLKISREIKVGFLFVVALVVLIWGVMYLKGLDIFRPKIKVYALYERVNGLAQSNPITINGLKVGQVSNIYFDPRNTGKIVVELIITEKYPIPVNSIARIYNSSLIGAKEVEIVLGYSKQTIKDGDTLRASIDASLSEEVNKQLGPLKEKAENLISTIDTVANSIKNILNEKTQRDLSNAINQVSLTISNLAAITHKVDTLVGAQKYRLAKIIGNVESISSNLKQNNEKITNIISNFSNLSDSISKANISGTFNRVNQTLTEMNQALIKINTGQGSLGLLINDNKLYDELTKSAKDLNLLLEDVKANPSKYVKISVF